MTRSTFSAEQIIAILRGRDAGAKTAEVCRRHGIIGAMFHATTQRFAGSEPSWAKRPQALGDGNAKLRRLSAEAVPDSAALKDLLANDGDARRQARGRRSSRTGPRDAQAAGVLPDRGRSVVGAVSAPAPG